MTLWLLWWVWLAAALVLVLIEVLISGFIFLGFAIGALGVMAILLVSDMLFTLPPLLLIFAGLSLAAWLVLRRLFALPRGQVKRFDHDINE